MSNLYRRPVRPNELMHSFYQVPMTPDEVLEHGAVGDAFKAVGRQIHKYIKRIRTSKGWRYIYELPKRIGGAARRVGQAIGKQAWRMAGGSHKETASQYASTAKNYAGKAAGASKRMITGSGNGFLSRRPSERSNAQLRSAVGTATSRYNQSKKYAKKSSNYLNKAGAEYDKYRNSIAGEYDAIQRENKLGITSARKKKKKYAQTGRRHGGQVSQTANKRQKKRISWSTRN